MVMIIKIVRFTETDDKVKGEFNMAYKTEEIRGHLIEPITFNNEIGGDDLYNKIKETFLAEINAGNILADMREDILKSGGLLFGSKVPLIIISNSSPENRFFDIGICVNEKTVSFPLLGESAENTKNNKKNYYIENGNRIKAALVKVDELKLQQEAVWQQSIIDCINKNIE